MSRCTLTLSFAAVGSALLVTARASDPDWIAVGQSAMVASDSEFASGAGRDILKAGGNAIDAAVAVSFALAVTRPHSTGLGGGGFLMVRLADGRTIVQDFRETAPERAAPDMFVKAAAANPANPQPSRYGHLAVAVPGLVAGRNQALSQYGTMSLAQTLAPAIRLARSGFPVDQHYVEATREVLKAYKVHPWLKDACPYVYETHLRRGRLRAVGASLVQPELARLLEGIAQRGPEFFYRGPVAQAIAKEMKQHGGIITQEDLARYQVRARQPLRSTYRGYQLLAMPPPSSGGIALIETLNILETMDWPALARSDPGLACHYQVEAMKHAFADRARWLGDDDLMPGPTTYLTSKAYARRLAATLRPDADAEPDAYGSKTIPDDAGTSHFCVVDRLGNVVVSTETINTSFGSLAAVAEWGLILNNEMDDFATIPGQPNAFALIQSSRNAIRSGTRPLSSMAPTIVLKDDAPYLLLGASGGPRIISSVLNVLLGVLDSGRSLEEAIRHPRPHHQWRPDRVFFDADPPEDLARALRGRGHLLADGPRTGVVQAVMHTDQGWVGASDPRKGGKPAGY